MFVFRVSQHAHTLVDYLNSNFCAECLPLVLLGLAIELNEILFVIPSIFDNSTNGVVVTVRSLTMPLLLIARLRVVVVLMCSW